MNTQIGSTIIDRKHGSGVLRETEINKATETIKPSKGSFSRRSFLGKSLAAGAVTMGAGLLANTLLAKEGNEKEKGHLKKGDAAILRFLAAAEIIEADLWQQYNELAGIQDSEVPGGTGSPAYRTAHQSDAADRGHELVDALPQRQQESRFRRHLSASNRGIECGPVSGDSPQRRRSRSGESFASNRQYRGLPFLLYRARRHQPLPKFGPTGRRRGGVASPAQYRPHRSNALSDVARQSR